MISAFSIFCIKQRKAVVVILSLITMFFAYFAVQTDVVTKFEDQQPTSHPYIKVHQKFKDTFGGSNIVTFMVKSKEGDIFQLPVLTKIQELTQGLVKIDAVNEFQIISLAGKKLKEVKASTEGIESKPYMWPDLPKNQDEINYLKDAVLRNPLVYGPVVSHDLKSTLITVDFFDNLIDYNKAFTQINALVAKVDGGPVEVSVVGNPVLYGWVNHYLPETVRLSIITIAFFMVALFLINRTWRGTFLPMVAAIVSATWALGICKLLNINFDPLLMVIAMLITARAVSHSVQMLTRFHEEVENIEDHNETSAMAARITLRDILRPGLLGIITDAGCLAVVALSPIPLLQKLTVLAVVWVLTMIISAVILTPVLLSWVKKPRGYLHNLDIDKYILRPILNVCVTLVTSRARFFVVGIAAIVFVVCGYNAFQLKVGDANPGSPILWPDAEYNQASTAINSAFPGSDRMFVVVGGGKTNGIKDVDALRTMQKFQRYMEAQPEIGGTLSIADILPAVNRTLREDNIRYQELGADGLQNGELMYMFEQAAEPGDLDRYVDNDRANGSVTLFFSDHQGKTIRTAIARIKQFIAENKLPPNAQIFLAGGYVGVLAAVNEVILSGQIESIALALLVMMLLCIVVYRSSIAGLFFMVPVVLSNIVTFAFMAWQNIGMSINTVPVAALGIGLGVDYALYICDRIKHEYEHGATETQAVTKAIHTSGRGVLVTAVVLVMGVLLWLLSSLRFQAEMGLLVALWLAVSATSAIVLMPTLALMFKPGFIFGYRAAKPAMLAEGEVSLATA
jgi:predicted RND superfamily exporter protein